MLCVSCMKREKHQTLDLIREVAKLDCTYQGNDREQSVWPNKKCVLSIKE